MRADVPDLDPITIEIVTSRLAEVTASMEHALYHAGYSPILRESRDGTAGLTDADGRVLMVGGGLQFHSLPYQQAVAGVTARFPRETLQPGDSFLVNDPYKAGNPHVPDFVTVTPSFHNGRLIGFGVSIAHKADVGGLVPGSSGAGSREIFHDGLRLPPVLYSRGGVVNEAVEDIIRTNSRIPDVVIGDLRGQIGATRIGAERLAALCEEYGEATITGVMRAILSLTAQRLSREIAAWPDGKASADGQLDSDGADLDTPVPFAVDITKTGSKLIIDFSRCAKQTLGPVNVNPWTARSAALQAVIASTDPTIPINSGVLEPVELVLPEGSVVNPRFPATINLYFPTAVLIYTLVMSALGKLNPARAVAPSGMVTGAIALGYPASDGRGARVQYELGATGLGGTSAGDGAAILQPMNQFTPGSPIEITETEYPVLTRRFEPWIDSAGAGTHRGGVGYIREYEIREACTMTLRSSGHRVGSWGLDGGTAPAISSTTLDAGGPREECLPAIATRRIEAGTRLEIRRTGGGGWGAPLARDPASVRDDVADGYVSLQAARDVYGVVLDPVTLAIDQAATKERRS